FVGLTEGMRQTLADRLRMVYTGDEGHELMSDTEMGLDVADTLCFQLDGARRKMNWRQFILALGLHTDKEIAEDGFGAYWLGSERHAEGRKSRARLSGGYFIGHLAAHFGLVSDQGLRGLSVVTHELPLIDLHELGRLNISGATGAAEDAHAVDEGAQADLAPVQAPQPPPPAPRTMPQRIAKLEEEVQELRWSIVGMRGDVDRSITDQGKFTTWMVSCMTQLMDARDRTYQAFDNTLVGSLQLPY
ncbi:hypothetical protein Tco_1555979, partial [Tanacetum coccineum]